MKNTPCITFTQESLTFALDLVHGLHEISTDKTWAAVDNARGVLEGIKRIRSKAVLPASRTTAATGEHGLDQAEGEQPDLDLQGGIQEILAERRNQIMKGYTASHDDQYSLGELAGYGVAHALIATGATPGWIYQMGICSWEIKPGEPRTLLITAAALLLAELDRFDRATGNAGAQAELERHRQPSLEAAHDC